MTHEHAAGADVLAVLGPAVALLSLLAYAVLVVRVRRRGRTWTGLRTLAWATGSLLATAAVAGPLASAAMASGTAHMVGHVLLGMLAPLLLVLGAPVTLALRGLPVHAARGLARLLRSRPLRLLTVPAVAGVLDVGGLWVLYGSPLLDVAHDHALVDVVVHLHVLLAGYLFTAVLVGPDPLPHRGGARHLLVVLVLGLAAHDVLAKRLYAQAAGALDPLDEQRGALVMYYGGDAVDLALAVLVCARWYRRARLRPAPSEKRPGADAKAGAATSSPSATAAAASRSSKVMTTSAPNDEGGREVDGVERLEEVTSAVLADVRTSSSSHPSLGPVQVRLVADEPEVAVDRFPDEVLLRTP